MRIAQVTGELRRKEAMLVTVKEEYMAEQGELLEKVSYPSFLWMLLFYKREQRRETDFGRLKYRIQLASVHAVFSQPIACYLFECA